MTACIIAYTFYELDFRVRRYAEALAGEGYTVDVIALRRDGEEKKGVFNGVNVYRIQRRGYKEKNVVDFMLNQMKFFFKGGALLSAKHISRRYRIVHVHNIPDFLIFMGLIPKLAGAKLILDVHDIVPEYYCQKFNKGFDSVLTRMLLGIERASVRYADHVIVANDIWRDKIIKRDAVRPEDCTTLLNYPQLDFFPSSGKKPANGNFTLIYPGTISKQHGVDVAIKAVALVKEKVKTIRLKIYHSGGSLFLREQIVALTKSLGLEENVEFYKPVRPETLGRIIAEADVGIVPKMGGIFADEAFSTKILDFMAAGIPVVASRTKVDEYYFDDSMIKFFEVGNPQDMARCIVDLYEKPKMRELLSANAKRFIEKNNWALKKGEYLKIVNGLGG